jgi:hypothetical protein
MQLRLASRPCYAQVPVGQFAITHSTRLETLRD